MKSPLINSVWALRKKSHLQTRLSLRDEKVFYFRTLPFSIPVYLLFSLLDYIVSSNRSFLYFIFLRALALFLSVGIFVILRARVKYATRAFLSIFPVAGCVQYIMISENLVLSPYFAGVGLVLVATLLQYQLRLKYASYVAFGTVSPTVIWSLFFSNLTHLEVILSTVMILGCAVITIIFSEELFTEVTKRYKIQEQIARESGKRQKIIEKQVNELIRRRSLEHQFSPQVVESVLLDVNLVNQMIATTLNIIVIDIERSSVKSKDLNPENYKKVIEEVFDVFSSVCLKWNITLDKFTGDGAQAFSGAPVVFSNDTDRVLQASFEACSMLHSRKKFLNDNWKSNLNIRISIVKGKALVGFIGKGRFKSYTAIGETVTLAHRLCAKVKPWHIGFLNLIDPQNTEVLQSNHNKVLLATNDLKGFEGVEYKYSEFDSKNSEDLIEVADLGRCKVCHTPLTLSVSEEGIYEASCPACVFSNIRKKIA